MATLLKQLGQLRPGNTTAASLYSPGASTQTIIKSIIICNTSGSSVKFRIFADDNGTTYDQTTALFYDAPLPANSTLQIDANILMDDSAGNLAVRTATANALTFTCWGAEMT